MNINSLKLSLEPLLTHPAVHQLLQKIRLLPEPAQWALLGISAALLFVFIFLFSRFIYRLLFVKKARDKGPAVATAEHSKPEKDTETPKPETAADTSPKKALEGELSWELTLEKSRAPLKAKLQNAWSLLSGTELWNEDHPLWESLEEALITSDLGPQMSLALLESLQNDFKEKPDVDHLKDKLSERMLEVFSKVDVPEITAAKPIVTLLVGINGSGKTTTAGKLARIAKDNGQMVILGAGDTFRAAAVEQLKAWADRIGVECIMPAKGANPAAVAFDAVAAALSRNMDEVIVDTAGRLHTKDALMDELAKVGRVVERKIEGAPHRVLLVLDATLGQNALIQAKEFTKILPATGVVLTKLDGSSKGGVALSVVAELGIPIEYVGVGESETDLRKFSSKDFVANLLS